MKKIEKLRNELDLIQLEDRLEMVNLAAVDTTTTETAGNGVCCCSEAK